MPLLPPSTNGQRCATDRSTTPPLILASSSPYRRILLERLRYPFGIDVPDIDETPRKHESPTDTAQRLAREKAEVVATRHPGAVVIGSDQVALCDGRQLGKSGHHAAALMQLRAMQGREVDFHTAVCIVDARPAPTSPAAPDPVCPPAAWAFIEVADVVTRVRFRQLPDVALEAYLHAETPYDVAGSAKCEGLGIALLESVSSDDPTALVGLPLITVTRLLMKAGIDLLGPR